MSTQASDGEYNVMIALKCFNNCVCGDGITIDLPKFIIAYKELIKYNIFLLFKNFSLC